MARILVVDDDHLMLQTMEDWLTFENHAVTVADGGLRGWEQLQENEYELVILDWDMPDLTGIDLLRKYRDAGGTTPVIMLTGHTSIDDKAFGLESGADDYVTKPFHMKELSARIKANMRKSTGPAAPPAPPPLPLGQANEELLKSADLIGTRLAASYEFLDVLGEGGYSVVYKARHPRLNRLVAIKMVRASKLQDTAIARFEREAQAVSLINHYNVVTIHDFGVTERNLPYIVMEYIEGEELGQKIDREGPLPLAVTAAILTQICSGLGEAHGKGIIHRDLKPNNVMLQTRSDRADWVKVVDFGLAHLMEGGQERLTTSGRVMGTPQFLAPERFRGDPADERSDIYSLGVLLFEMLTARRLFKAETTESLVIEVLASPRLPPSNFREDIIPGSAFDNMFLKAVERNPERRYQSVAELREELGQIHSQLLQSKRP